MYHVKTLHYSLHLRTMKNDRDIVENKTTAFLIPAQYFMHIADFKASFGLISLSVHRDNLYQISAKISPNEGVDSEVC